MRAGIALLVISCFVAATPIHVAAEEPRRQIQLTTYEILRSIDSLPKRHPLDPERFLDDLVDYLKRTELGVGGLFTLLPAEAEPLGTAPDVHPPRFAFVARTGGRTLVSVTKIGSTADEEDRVLHQRWLISDLMKGQRYSLTVYKEHTLDKDALRFLGVGARLMLRPKIEMVGWRFGFEMYGSYHPDHQGTAYLALTGKTISPPPPPLAGAVERAAQRHGALVPLRW